MHVVLQRLFWLFYLNAFIAQRRDTTDAEDVRPDAIVDACLIHLSIN